MQICPSWFTCEGHTVIVSSSCLAEGWMSFLHIWIGTCRDNICTSLVSCILHPARLTYVLLCFIDHKGCCGGLWECGLHLTCVRNPTMKSLLLYQSAFLKRFTIFPPLNACCSMLLRGQHWRLVVLGWASAGVGKMSSTCRSTRRAEEYNSLFCPKLTTEIVALALQALLDHSWRSASCCLWFPMCCIRWA